MNLAALKELMVLRVVQDHPAHGYALAEVLSADLGQTLGLTRATIYAVLQRLEKRGWLVSEQHREGRYPEKHVYSLTPEGKAGYASLLERTVRAGGLSIQPFPALLLHLDELSAEERLEGLADLREERIKAKQRLAAFPPHDGSAGIALTFMTRQLELEIDTLDQLLRVSARAK